MIDIGDNKKGGAVMVDRSPLKLARDLRVISINGRKIDFEAMKIAILVK